LIHSAISGTRVFHLLEAQVDRTMNLLEGLRG
jgi:hypothetical protein